MTDKPKVDDVVVIGISKFQLGPNDMLAIQCPEKWNIQQVEMFSRHYGKIFEQMGIKALVFPRGVDFHIIEDAKK